jgi:hypothetical protein
LKLHGYHVTIYKCPGLGNILYRDKFQAAAYPSDRDGKITTPFVRSFSAYTSHMQLTLTIPDDVAARLEAKGVQIPACMGVRR